MVELFIIGDPHFMGMLSIPLLVIILLALDPYHKLFSSFGFACNDQKRLKSIRAVGLFALILGIFTQLLGLYGALESIRVWGEVKASMLFQGLKVSFIYSGYGLFTFTIARLLTGLPKKTVKPAH